MLTLGWGSDVLTDVNKGEERVKTMLLRDKIAYFAQSLHSKSNNFAFCLTESIPQRRGGGSTLVNMIMEGFLSALTSPVSNLFYTSAIELKKSR